MATIRAYTTIEQSRKLAEILPIESADMRYDEYTSYIDGTPKVGYKEGITEGIPCWSLAALLCVLPEPYQLTSNKEGKVQLILMHHLEKDYYDNPVDAAFEMITKLNELKSL